MNIRGYIDIHTHGIGNFDTRTDNPEDILKMAELHGRKGTRGILPTIYPASIAEMRKNMEAVRKAMESQIYGLKSQSATIIGINIEGPFLNPLRCGAMDKKSFISPSASSLKKLISGYEDIIRIMTVAPEVKGALKIIEKCVEVGIKVNMGHSDATYRQAVEGKKAGATGITHIFNAMRPFHHREPGLAGFGLIDEDIYIEVIADGVHLHSKTLELIFSKKRLDKIMLVSDSVSPVRKSGRGFFSNGVKGGKGLAVYKKAGILAGSGITLADSIKILKHIGIPEAEIIEAAVENPERYLSLM